MPVYYSRWAKLFVSQEEGNLGLSVRTSVAGAPQQARHVLVLSLFSALTYMHLSSLLAKAMSVVSGSRGSYKKARKVLF